MRAVCPSPYLSLLPMFPLEGRTPLGGSSLQKPHTNPPQHNAATTSAPAHSRACTSRTTVLARGRRTRIKLSWGRGLQFVGPKGDGRRVSLLGRLRWRGRGYFRVHVWGSWDAGCRREIRHRTRVRAAVLYTTFAGIVCALCQDNAT